VPVNDEYLSALKKCLKGFVGTLEEEHIIHYYVKNLKKIAHNHMILE